MSSQAIGVCQQSVDADVPASFAWQYMTNVSNWSDPPAEFSLDGSFSDGARGTTRMPDQPTREWTIRGVDSGRSYTIQGELLEGARMLVHWRFESLPGRRSRLTQRIELVGNRAAAYADDVRAAFEPNLEPGMRRIAALMAQAWDVNAGACRPPHS
jgi:hypothetical protein